MTPEEKALIEAVGVWVEFVKVWAISGPALDLRNTYDAYMASLTTPPSVLPPAPEGKRWARVEYVTEIGISHPHDDDWLLMPGFHGAAKVGTDFTKGRAVGMGFGWRLVDDPEADSLEKIAEEFERAAHAHRVLLNPAAYADRVRALIGEGQ